MIRNQRLQEFLSLAGAAFILMLFALYNGFPIISGDTMVYLQSGFELKAAAERPIFYGLFVRFTGGFLSVWLTMWVQCLLLAFLLSAVIRHFFKSITLPHLFGLLFIISLGTICSWYAGQLMPDIFTAILALSLFLFLFGSGKRRRIVYAFIVFLAVLVHFSHYAIFTLLVLALLLLSFLSSAYKGVFRKRVLVLTAIMLLSWLSLMSSNYFSGRGFVTSSVSHVFLMGKLSESGVLKTYLKKACPVYGYRICPYQDSVSMPAWEFVWDEGKSPVFKTGGWEVNRQEYKAIIKDIASRPKYWPFLAYKSVEATCRQIILTNIDEGEERPWIRFSSADVLVQDLFRYFPHEAQMFLQSRQNTKILNLVFYDDLYIIVIMLSTLFVLFCSPRDFRQRWWPAYAFLLFFILLNAFATASLGNVLSRLNSRVIWLLPMLNILVLYDWYIGKGRKKID